ncbi:MAG: nucleotidyltransferase domain-containing protein [Candidatus Woesearchaeota archaeon]
MGKPSKEAQITELFFNEPSRPWHFKDIVRQAKISENRANYWLKILKKEQIILYNKIEGEMPFYTANFAHSNYKMKKKLYALEHFYKIGFLRHLELLDADTIVIFGSFSRADWHTKSDIDLFIIGSDEKLEKDKYESLLKREIQLFTFKNKKEIQKVNPYLINNVTNGYFIKGNVQNIIGGTNT